MTTTEKLLERAENAPASLTFRDLCTLAEQLGWARRRTKGSHHIYSHPNADKVKDRYPRPLNLQKMKDGKAKPEQVKEVLKRARDMGIIDEGVAP